MAIRVLTIEREYGSGGALIAGRIAQRLGWPLWDSNLSAEIARLAKAPGSFSPSSNRPQPSDPLLYKLAKVFARGSYERSLPLENPERLDAERLIEILTEVIQRVAKSGPAVIVGRGAAFILRDHPEAFHVFIFAPYEEKLRRLIEFGKSHEESVKLLETIDQERAAFIKQYTGRSWPNRYLYNLWINSVIGDEAVIDVMLNAMSMLDGRGIQPRACRETPSD